MSTYKITNITNFLGKRDYNYNSNLDVEFVDNMMKKIVTIKPNDSVYLTIQSLPLSIHRLRVKNLITVSETNEVPQISVVASKPKKVVVSQPEIKVGAEEKKVEKKIVEKKEPEK